MCSRCEAKPLFSNLKFENTSCAALLLLLLSTLAAPLHTQPSMLLALTSAPSAALTSDTSWLWAPGKRVGFSNVACKHQGVVSLPREVVRPPGRKPDVAASHAALVWALKLEHCPDCPTLQIPAAQACVSVQAQELVHGSLVLQRACRGQEVSDRPVCKLGSFAIPKRKRPEETVGEGGGRSIHGCLSPTLHMPVSHTPPLHEPLWGTHVSVEVSQEPQGAMQLAAGSHVTCRAGINLCCSADGLQYHAGAGLLYGIEEDDLLLLFAPGYQAAASC